MKIEHYKIMARTAYILTFDREEILNFKDIHNKIVNLPEVITWFHYIKSSYILISDISSATTLNNNLLKILTDKRYLLIELNLQNRNGRLPNAAWDWIRNQAIKIE